MNILDIFARLGLDTTEYDEGLERSERKGGAFGNGLKTAARATIKALAAAAVAASAAVGTLITKSVSAYAQYEQLVGGVKKLFSTDVNDASTWVFENAQRAWKTVGMSANQYMELATGFAAKLIADLDGDTQAAAALTDKAITDMADNANTFGTDISSIQKAYEGFARGNYMMLDNLKLGYAGTK